MSKPTIAQVIKSVLAAAIGVQSDDNRQKDFTQASTWVAKPRVHAEDSTPRKIY